MLKMIRVKKFHVEIFLRFVRSTNLLTVDGYNMDECLARVFLAFRYWESQISLSGVVVDQIFTSGGVDVRAHAYHHHIHFYLRVKFS